MRSNTYKHECKVGSSPIAYNVCEALRAAFIACPACMMHPSWLSTIEHTYLSPRISFSRCRPTTYTDCMFSHAWTKKNGFLRAQHIIRLSVCEENRQLKTRNLKIICLIKEQICVVQFQLKRLLDDRRSLISLDLTRDLDAKRDTVRADIGSNAGTPDYSLYPVACYTYNRRIFTSYCK